MSHFELLTKEDLIIAAVATKRPIAFLVGAPLSLHAGNGVPGVAEMLDLIRNEIGSRAAFSLSRFEASLAGKSGGKAYQEAMKWLGARMGQDAINDVITTAVLKARKAGTAKPPLGTDGRPDEWNIPSGTTGLAELVARGGERFLGPILTTNFDPLISLAIHKSGGYAVRQVLTGDATLIGAAADNPTVCPVVHLHGFWRDSDTLHTQAQLTSPRPKLARSLQRLLQKRTLIVAAYGGWEDFFTRALIELMNDEQAPLDVIWCFYEPDVSTVKEKYGRLLGALEPAIMMNRFRAFGGVDCHGIFAEVLSTLRGMTSATEIRASASPLAGWQFVDAAYLAALSPLSTEEVIRYFDGATPTWRHAECVDIPRRAAVGEITRRFEQVRTTRAACSLQLIRAAGGEGKTTLLLQAAATVAKNDGWNVLWRPDPRVGLPPEHIITLDPTKHWLIVSDDAENLVHDFGEAARLLHEAGCFHVHFLLAARDTDWRHFGGERQSWGTLVTQHPDIRLRDLRDDDARMLVAAWRKYGNEGLRDLASLADTDHQVYALLDAVRGAAAARDEGSFFGGLLAVRFGTDGLTGHVIALLNRLKNILIKNSEHNLFDALLYIAACHAVGIPGLDEKVLADLVGVERDWVQTLVVTPLGEEAAAVRSAGQVLTRHKKVASAVVVAAEQDLGADIAEIWAAIVRQTVKTSKDVRVSHETFSSVVHAGPRLARELPTELTEQRRKEIAIAAAKADVAAEPERLCALVDLGKTYRSTNEIESAIRLFRENLRALPRKVDYYTDARGYWNEWGGAEGRRGPERIHALQSAWVCGLSLSDYIEAEITEERVKLSCAGTGVAFGNLAQPRPDCQFGLARRATAFLGLLANPDEKGRSFFMSDHREADEHNIPRPTNVDEAIEWLKTAMVQAGRELTDPFLKAILKPEAVSFNKLREFMAPSPPQHLRSEQLAAPPSEPSAVVVNTEAVQLLSELDDRIKVGIERVLTEAWASVSPDTASENRFKVARQNADASLSRLSPHIKRQVRAHFYSENWGSLKARDPKR